MEVVVGRSTRSTPPGRKRLLITLSVVLSFLLGTPLWWKSTEVYRSPLPFAAIETHANQVASLALALPCDLHVIFVALPIPPKEEDQQHLQVVVDQIQQQISIILAHKKQFNSSESCASGFQVHVTLDAKNVCLRSRSAAGDQQKNKVAEFWPCGLATVDSDLWELLLESSSDDDNLVDEFFWSFSKGEYLATGGCYTLVLFDEDLLNIFSNEKPGEATVVEVGNQVNPISKEGKGKRRRRRVVGKYRHAWMIGPELGISSFGRDVASEIADLAVMYFSHGGRLIGKDVVVEDKEESMPLSADGKAILSFSLLNAEPSDWIFDWFAFSQLLGMAEEEDSSKLILVVDLVIGLMGGKRAFEEVEQRFLQPLVEALWPFAHLFVESQVLYYTPKAVQSHWDAALQSHVVPFKQLPFFVNANEWHLDSSSAAAGRSKLLHFAIYVPAAKECPLHLQLSTGRISQTNGFTSPGWGGIIVWNPPGCLGSSTDNSTAHQLSTKELEPLIGVVVAQLRTLFGLPPTVLDDSKTDTFGVPATARGFADWGGRGENQQTKMVLGWGHREVDVLLRRRAVMDVHASASTLASLSRLVSSLPNMVIMDEIGDQVTSSLTAAKAAREHAISGAYHATADAARKARGLAEAAFFQPSIMSLLYFPAEHQLAIYTPFFVPVLLHMLVAVIKESSRYRRERRSYLRGLQNQD